MKRKIISIFLVGLLCGCAVTENAANETIQPQSTVDVSYNDYEEEQNIEYRTLIVDTKEQVYTYDDMVYDLETMSIAYKDFTSLNILAKTLDGKNIYDFVIGDLNADKHIIIHASIHAREYITSKLVMKQLSHYLSNLNNKTGQYNGIPYSELFDGVAVHVLPMINPDGVTLSQSGIESLTKQQTKDRVHEVLTLNGLPATDKTLKMWKANANGVDLNRNFDARWDEFIGSEKPAPDRYKGKNPGSEPEAQALIEITTQYPVVRTISYHTSGEVIYWYFGQSGALYEESRIFAEQMSAVTGYPTDANYEQLDPAGYKDWALDKLSIPSITIEVGSGETPIPESQISSIYEQNKNVWPEVLYQINEMEE